MPRAKKSSKSLMFDQPFIGFRTSFRTQPVDGKKKKTWQTQTMNFGGSCREEIIWDTREHLQSRTMRWEKMRDSWKQKGVLKAKIDVDHSSLKQPGVTYLWLEDNPDDYYDNNSHHICTRPCCIGRFPQILDALVGTLGVVLNPDRYQGNWWETSPEELIAKRRYGEEFRWYGIDNFFLKHPVLTSIVLGMFRQAILLYEQGFDGDLLATIDRKDVVRALTDSDPVLAMRILTRLRPWVEVPNSGAGGNYPFSKGRWERLGQLRKAIYNHGFEKLFDGDIHEAWNIVGKESDDQWSNRYTISTGPDSYWGRATTAASKRLAKLGR